MRRKVFILGSAEKDAAGILMHGKWEKKKKEGGVWSVYGLSGELRRGGERGMWVGDFKVGAWLAGGMRRMWFTTRIKHVLKVNVWMGR